MKVNLKILGGILIAISVIVAISVTYYNSPHKQNSLVFSKNFFLDEIWKSYKDEYIEKSSGRVLDKQRDNITTSEGMSYVLLRAVWQDDKGTFDRCWTFTKDNLKRKEDNLFSWKFGKRSDNSYGVTTEDGGQNTASDADVDIAIALIFAYTRWSSPQYLDQAKLIINDIWEKEVVLINGKPVLAANNLEKSSPENTIINPSYFSPSSFRIFALIDKTHDWNALKDNSYDILLATMTNSLDKGTSANLPPDWVNINKKTGAISRPPIETLTTNYGYDAMRVPFRLYVDYEWYKEPRAKELLTRMNFINNEWNSKKRLSTVYSHDGKVVTDTEAPAVYGGNLGVLMATDTEAAQALYESKLKDLYNPDTQSWKQTLSYYDDNWAWFGIALYNKKIVNLAKEIKP